jgi:SRSO17 transposase
MKLLLLLFVPFLLLAQSNRVSNIPLPQVYVQNLDIYPCDEACLTQLLEHEQIFSFIAHSDIDLKDSNLSDSKLLYVTLFNLGSTKFGGEFKIAMLLPHKKIGRYAYSTTNSVFSYMLAKNANFEISSFKIESESKEDVQKALAQMTQQGFHFVIAPMTRQGVETLIEINPDLHVYFPTINSKDINTTAKNFYFGGIDYEAQNQALFEHATSPLVIFHNRSTLSKKLRDSDKAIYEQLPLEKKRLYDYEIKRRTSNLAHILKRNKHFKNGTAVLNMPLIKSSMVMSQLTLHDSNITTILSTQINYDPLIFSTTQYRDRKSMLIANSISGNSPILAETNRLLGNDITYDWINHSTSVGVDFFYYLMTGEPREYPLPILNNQVQYPVEIVKPNHSKFELVSSE